MNEPIINPWMFYLIEKCAMLHGWSFIIAIIISVVLAWSKSSEEPSRCKYPYGWEDKYTEDKESWKKECRKTEKRITAILAISVAITFLAPSRETMYKMLIAQQLTKQNIEVVKGNLNDALDNIVEKIIKVKNETSKG